MHVKEFLHEMLSSVMHLKRLMTLKLMVETVLAEKRLSLTGLGRALPIKAQERSGVRRADRFLGNVGLKNERIAIYGEAIRILVGNKGRSKIIVDWSPIPNTTHNVLRAALVTNGRALSLYEEVHLGSKLGNQKVHRNFLKTLKKKLPESCKPIIVTDAGFHSNWFAMVSQLGWDYVGRVRGLVKYHLEGEKDWNALGTLYGIASRVPKLIGKVILSKSNPIECLLCVFREKKKYRIAKNKLGERRRNTDSKSYSKSAKEPWILATSLIGSEVAHKIIKIYKNRMQIEEGFRDLKSSEYGFGFEKSRTKNIDRIQILLLIAMLASLIAWLTGWAAEKKGLQYQFQANSIKHMRVLSLFFLGCRVIGRKISISLQEMVEGLVNIQLELGVINV